MPTAGTGAGREMGSSPVGARDSGRFHRIEHPAPGHARARGAPTELRRIYDRYCDHEARALLALVPREGLRNLHARARRETVAGHDDDPMARLVVYVRRLLPLPPYERWLEAYLADRRPFLEALGIASVPERSEPVLIEVRPAFEGWMAELHLLRIATGEWRGFLCFAAAGGSEGPYRTADIFRGSDPDELVTRFREFHSATLEAFFRSVRP